MYNHVKLYDINHIEMHWNYVPQIQVLQIKHIHVLSYVFDTAMIWKYMAIYDANIILSILCAI